MSVTWRAAVRFGEVDSQRVVFNAHYLTYCDEALYEFCTRTGAQQHLGEVQVVTTTMTWRSALRWGDVVEIDVTCPRVGRTSFTLDFVVRSGERVSCEVTTVYVHVDDDGRATPVPEQARQALSPRS